MKQILLFGLLIFGMTSYTNAKIKVYGKITGYDGKPTMLAHVAKSDDDAFAPLATADAQGNYSLYLDDTGFYSLTFFGTFHLYKEVKFYIPKELNEINIDVQLPPIVISNPNKVRLIGDFNSFKFDSEAIPFTLKDGKYTATVPNSGDTLRYQLLYELSPKEGLRSFNGSQADFYVKDRGNDFISCILTKEKNVQIMFDSTKYANSAVKALVSSKDSLTSKFLNLFVDCGKLRNNFLYYAQQKIVNKSYDSIEIVKLEYVDKYISKIEAESNPLIRALYIYNLWEIASYGGNTKTCTDKNLAKYSQELIKAFDAKSNIWENYYDLFYIIEAIESPFTNSYYQNVVANHPNPDVRDLALYKLLENTEAEKYKQYRDEYIQKYKTQFPNGRYIKTALRKYSPDRAIEIGKTIPDFKLPRLENLKDTLTANDLRGKYTLVDIWGTWCAPCRSEMPYLDSAFNIFKDKNFNIISIAFDRTPETVQKFREGKWKMPWTHAFVTGMYENPIADSFQIIGVPTVFLIDPNGKIIEDDSNLRGEDLIPTLQKHIK